jgi:hypothetical protein
MRKLLAPVLVIAALSAIPTPASAASCSPVESTVNGDKVLTFTNTTACDWTLPLGVTTFKVLVVGGGGGGGADGGSGGGGGAIYAGTINRSTDTNRKITVTVGAGGAGVFHTPNAAGGAGTSSTLVYTDQNSQTLTLTSSGGGVGVWGGPTDATYAGGSGGSTPSVSDNSSLISITEITKSAGGAGGNGINFESTSSVPGNGTGGTNSITEFSGNYGGGGGGGATQKTPTTGRTGGTGSYGGGNGGGGLTGTTVATCPTAGAINSGGGGGGGAAHGDVGNCANEAYNSRNGKSGAAGVVKIRYTPVTVPTNPSSFSSSESVANTVTVAITAPNDGGSPITNYQYSFDEVNWVDYSPATGPGNVTLTFDTSARAFAPTTFYFKAVNEVGASKSSWDVTASSRSKVTMYTGGQNSLPFVTTNDAPSGTKMSGSTLGNGLGIIGKPSASISRQWQSCTSSTDLTSCSDIAGATSNTYVLTDSEVGKYIRTKVTGTNAVGATVEYSPLTSSIAALADVTSPTVNNINSSTANGSYKAGAVISIQVTFSENVTVTGTPRLTLETGSTDRIVDYASGSGTNTLTFTYTVQAGDTSADLDYVATSSLALNSGTIKDAANNNATLTLASPAASNSLGANKAIIIDTTAPTQTISAIDISADTGSSATDFITATAAQTITGALSANLGSGESLWGSVNGGVSYTNISSSVTGTAISWAGATLSGTSSIKFEVRDAAGNVGTAATQNYELDTTAPTQTISGIDISADTGSSATDFLTSTASQTITGTLSANLGTGESLWGSIDGGVNYSDVSSSVTGTAISWPSATLSGSSSIKFQVRDSAGAGGSVATQSYVLDTTAPTPTVATVSVTTSNGVTIKSSEAGTAYLVKSTVSVSNLASITSAADDSMNQVTIANANTDTSMSTAGLIAGEYKLYVVDAAGNLSSVSSNTVTVAVAAAPTSNSTAAPTGTTTFGSTLTNAVTFNGVPSPTLSYQWKSCTNATDTATVCSDISGATNSSFIANVVDLVGKFIRVLVTAINGESPDATAWSSPTAAITAVAPGIPTLGTPTLSDLQINVPVTAPASNGGSTITKYQFSTDGGATWMDRSDTATVSSPIVIKFLSTDGTTPIVAGTTYPVQIRAVNSASSPNGLGTTSVSVVAATAPGAPTAVSATATGQSTATVSFTAPTSNGGSAITSYTVTSSPGGVTATGSSSPISVTGLTASTAYTFTVTASNAAATSVASTASTSVTTSAAPAAPVAPPAPEPAPEPVCNAACAAAAAKVIADRVAAEAKVVAEKIASDTAAKVVAEKVVVDKSAAEAAAKVAIDKAAAAAVAKAAANAAAVQAATIAKAAADAQAAAVVAAQKAAAALKSSTTSAATKAAATASAAKAATTAASTVQAAAAAAKVAATAKNVATNASKQVDIAIGALGSKTAAAASAAQANAIAAAAKAAANEAAKAAADQAAAAKVASNNANREATSAAARIATEQKEAADAAAQAKAATDAVLKATEEKIAAATEAQKSAEAVVKALEEKIALAEASVKAKDVTERAAIDKKIEEVSAKVAEAQRVADTANARAEATVTAQESAQAVATAASQQAQVQAAEAVAVRAESTAKTAAATKAAADASLAAKIATAAKAAAAKVPSRAVISTKPSSSTSKNSAKATISGLKPGQKVKVTVNVKGK